MGKSRRHCFSDDIEGAIHIGVDQPPIGRPKEAAGDPFSQIDRLFFDRLQVKEGAFGGITFFLVDDLYPLQPGLIGHHVDKPGVGYLDKVLVVPATQVDRLFAPVILADNPCPEALGRQMVDNPLAGDVQVVG